MQVLHLMPATGELAGQLDGEWIPAVVVEEDAHWVRSGVS